MKTRTLLLLAVGCGLVILVAGGIKLFLLTDDTASVHHLQIGDHGKAGDMTVTVESVRHTDDQMMVDVSLVGAEDDNAAESFVYVASGEEVHPSTTPTTQGATCAATSQTTVTHCVLAFDTPDDQGVLRYDRAGEKLLWDIVGQSTG